MPLEKFENGAWLHANRLPLGCGWSGTCTAPGHEGTVPSHEELQNFCNLGYAEGCARLPQNRTWDSVRFSARTFSNATISTGSYIKVLYVCERGHLPAEHGFLEFDPREGQWARPHPDRRVQRMAECFLATYCEKKKRQDATAAAS
jgi:hypothetical protein